MILPDEYYVRPLNVNETIYATFDYSESCITYSCALVYEEREVDVITFKGKEVKFTISDHFTAFTTTEQITFEFKATDGKG